MAKRKDTASVVVEFFRDAQPETARTVFAIVKGDLEKRGLLGAKKKAAPRGKASPQDSNQA